MKLIIPVVSLALTLLAGCVSEAQLAANDRAVCTSQAPLPEKEPYRSVAEDDRRAEAEYCIAVRAKRRWDATNALLDMGSSYSAPVYQPTFSAPPSLNSPSVYTPPASNWSGTSDYSRHVQPAPQFMPAVPGPAAGDGGYGLH
jgi:outer membrane murein-binding lipoprotein Lpp